MPACGPAGASPWAGDVREPERRVVRDLLRRAQQGTGGMVLVEGEPGIRKSLLLRDCVDEAARHGFSLAAGAAAAPVPVCLDDAQWACPATLAALRTLPRALRRHPVAWVLARSSTPQQDTEYLRRGRPFDLMVLRGGMRAALVTGPDGHRFLVEERVRDRRRVPDDGGPYGGAQSRQPPGGTQP